MKSAKNLDDGVRLRDLFVDANSEVSFDVPDITVNDITANSGCVRQGGLFLACQGTHHHGLDFADEAVAARVAAIAWEPQACVQAPAVPASVAAFPVDGLDARVGDIADRFFGAPSAQITVTGITGTNGKTTTAWLASEALNRLVVKSAYMGTLGYGVVPQLEPSALTTPGCISVHRRLRELLDDGVSNAVMEVSSHGLDQGRIDGVRVKTAAFTNLSRDHLDYHGDFDTYKAAKAKLFSGVSLQTAVINVGDPFGVELANGLSGRVRTITVALNNQTRPSCEPELSASYIEVPASGLQIKFTGAFGTAEMNSVLWGQFNAENLLVAVGILLAHDYSLKQAVAALEVGSAPPGRMQVIKGAAHDPMVIVDFAHTPDALAKALETVRNYCDGKIVCVFGCGGERDQGKRGEMGAIANQLADHIIITSDNPRNEDPQAIIDAILHGIDVDASCEVVEDRANAISRAINMAVTGDAVLVAGKGSENYQLIAGRAETFSDQAVVTRALGMAS